MERVARVAESRWYEGLMNFYRVILVARVVAKEKYSA